MGILCCLGCHEWDTNVKKWDNIRVCKICGKRQMYTITGSEGDFGWVAEDYYGYKEREVKCK
jgi:hypothetical protein